MIVPSGFECPRGNRHRSPRRLGGLTGVGVGSPVLGRAMGGERGDLGSASLEGSTSKVRPGPWGWWPLPTQHLGEQCRAAREGVSWAHVRVWVGGSQLAWALVPWASSQPPLPPLHCHVHQPAPSPWALPAPGPGRHHLIADFLGLGW